MARLLLMLSVLPTMVVLAYAQREFDVRQRDEIFKREGNLTVNCTFVCMDGTCIDVSSVCDSVADCAHGEDEANCTVSPGLCAGFCGGQSASGCFCDASCEGLHDCCDSYQHDCSGHPGPGGVNPGLCAGFCGGQSASGCFCDASCEGFHDCCDGYQYDCSGHPGSGGAGSCVNSCGGQSGECYCDSLCGRIGDCCHDYEVVCSGVGSCFGMCGGAAPGGDCYCDTLCARIGDCCYDHQMACSDSSTAGSYARAMMKSRQRTGLRGVRGRLGRRQPVASASLGRIGSMRGGLRGWQAQARRRNNPPQLD